MTKPKTVDILGSAISTATIEDGIKQATKAMTAARSSYIVLPYVEFIMRARRDPTIQNALNAAWLRLPNGVALNWAGQYLYGGNPGIFRLCKTLTQIVFQPEAIHAILPARFDSSNFTFKLLKLAAEQHQGVFLIGSPKRQSIDAVGAYVSGRISGLQIVGTFTGQLNPTKESELITKLKTAKPALILVGIGFPRQELLMQRLVGQIDSGLMIGEGGSFDYQDFGGHLKRAPVWVRRIGLEWLWRLAREPKRLGRQLAIPQFIWAVYLEGRKQLHR